MANKKFYKLKSQFDTTIDLGNGYVFNSETKIPVSKDTKPYLSQFDEYLEVVTEKELKEEKMQLLTEEPIATLEVVNEVTTTEDIGSVINPDKDEKPKKKKGKK